MTTAARPRSEIHSGASTLLVLVVALLGSLAAHAVAGAILAWMGVDVRASPVYVHVDLDVFQPPPPPAPEPETPPPPEPEPEPPPPEPEPERERRADREERREREPETPQDLPPVPEPPAARREEPVDFGGLTLTNDQGAWATQVGSGAPMTGPITTARHVGPRSVRGRDDGVRGGTGTGPGGSRPRAVDRSRDPIPHQPPNAGDYPIAAREAGIEGVVSLRVTVGEDGRVVRTELVGNDPGWGMRDRCERSVRTRWRFDPALDADGRPVRGSRLIRCRYELED